MLNSIFCRLPLHRRSVRPGVFAVAGFAGFVACQALADNTSAVTRAEFDGILANFDGATILIQSRTTEQEM